MYGLNETKKVTIIQNLISLFRIYFLLQKKFFTDKIFVILEKQIIMGLVYADVELINLADETLFEDGYLPKEKVRSLPIRIMADSGAIRLTINESIKSQLGLRTGAATGANCQAVRNRNRQRPRNDRSAPSR